MYKLVLLRHGESEWNKLNLFTGWTDVDLTEKGEQEAREAGKLLLNEGFEFDIAFVSVLKRALRTLWLCLEEMNQLWIPWEKSWRLNERHYGALQGLNKAETVKLYGEQQVLLWRRSYDIAPPSLTKDDKRYPGNERIYKDIPENELPLSESLKDTYDRFLPYWKVKIAPTIKEGKRVLIVAHGNSLRALVKYLDNISNEDIINLNIPTGMPLVYELDDNLIPLRHYYLGDPEIVKKATEAVKNQIKIDKV